MSDVLLESVRAFVILGLLLFLVQVGRTRRLSDSRGWNWILGGFFLLLFGSLIDITDNFDTLNRFVVIGDTETEAFLEKVVGFLGGFIVLAIGLVSWLPKELTARKRAEELLTTAIESMSEGFAYYDADDRLVVVNKNMAKIYPLISDVFVPGKTFEEVLRTGVERGQFVEAQGREEEFIQSRLAYHREPKGAVEYNLPDGRWIRVEEMRTPSGGVIGIRTDITSLRIAEKKIEAQRDELRDLNDQKNKLFSIIAHDLKSPFTSLLGMSQVMAEISDTLTPTQFVDYAKSINENARRLFGLLENLLDWPRSQMDQVAFELQPHDLGNLIEQNIDLFSHVVEEKRVHLVSNVPTLTVHADIDMANTVIRNLLNNAIKFTEESGSITVSAERKGDWVEVSVADTGVGMTPDRVDGLFRLDTAQSTKGTRGEAGTGLGLLICRDFVEKHGGMIQVESTQGNGSTFRFTLPFYRR